MSWNARNAGTIPGSSSILLGSIYELYIALGEKSYDHLRGDFAYGVIVAIVFIAGLAQLAAVLGIFIQFSVSALVWFAIAGLAALLIGAAFSASLRSWWERRPGQG